MTQFARHGLQFVRRRAMLPDGKTNQSADVGVQRPLRQQSGQVTRQHVAAATLRQMRIAGRVHENFPSLRPTSVWCPFNTTQQLPYRREISRTACGRFAWTCCWVVFSSRAASPGCGVRTRMAFLADTPIGSQSSVLASTTIGKSESRHIRRVVCAMTSARPGAARPGPIRIALALSGSLKSGRPQIHHRRLQL